MFCVPVQQDGQQFPPFSAIEREANPRLSIFVPNFVLPLHFDYQKDVMTRGIKLKRYGIEMDLRCFDFHF